MGRNIDDDRTWQPEDEAALNDHNALLAIPVTSMSDDEIAVAAECLTKSSSSWTEWIVLSGELDRIDTNTDTPTWAWIPNSSGGVSGEDTPMSQDQATKIFDEIDPMGVWFRKRWNEARAGKKIELERKFEVELICQVCSVDEDSGIVCVRDDIMTRKKSFDINGDKTAQILCAALLANI